MDSCPFVAYSGRTLCLGSSGVEQWTENPRVGGSNPPPGTSALSGSLSVGFTWPCHGERGLPCRRMSRSSRSTRGTATILPAPGTIR